jgi:hypothetical protein
MRLAYEGTRGQLEFERMRLAYEGTRGQLEAMEVSLRDIGCL